jgi:hypothetical protein
MGYQKRTINGIAKTVGANSAVGVLVGLQKMAFKKGGWYVARSHEKRSSAG